MRDRDQVVMVGSMATNKTVDRQTETESQSWVLSAAQSYKGAQGLVYVPGVSAETFGTRGLWLGTVVLAAGGRTKSHVHTEHESALYMATGEQVEVWTGDRLGHCEQMHPGDYLYVPPGLLHVAVNRTRVDALFVVARTDPHEHESVTLRPEFDHLVD
jgi:uncharacterized RmlC-like cupin family protein